jgi:hypothetical protein
LRKIKEEDRRRVAMTKAHLETATAARLREEQHKSGQAFVVLDKKVTQAERQAELAAKKLPGVGKGPKIVKKAAVAGAAGGGAGGTGKDKGVKRKR